LLLERLSPALEHVDSSSGAMGSAVNRAIEMLVEIIASAPADARTRGRWLDRLWEAYQADQIPYLERLGDYWGDLCASKDLASDWADRLLEACRMAWSDDLRLRGFFQGSTNCLSALLEAGRYQDILDLLEMRPHTIWNYRRYGVKALAAMGRPSEAIRCAGSGDEWAKIVSRVRESHHRKMGFMSGFENLVAGSGPSRAPSFVE
jgi:hypothetical protein